jgi:hypothetical protein
VRNVETVGYGIASAGEWGWHQLLDTVDSVVGGISLAGASF